MSADLPLGLAAEFPAASRLTYLNSASVGLMYRDAAQAEAHWQSDIAEFGTAHFDEVAEARVFDDARIAFARLINATPADIAIGSSTTDLLSSVAWAIHPGAGTKVVGTDISFPSTMYPWIRISRSTGCGIRWITAVDSVIDEEEILGAIDHDTSVVCLSHVEYATGQRYDLGRLAQRAHEFDALLVIDASQSVGAVPLDVRASDVDVLVSAAYKWLCGPFGVAAMYVRPTLQNLEPGLVGWRSHAEIYDLNARRLRYPDGARRFEYSTIAYGSAVGLTRSMRFLHLIGLERIQHHNLTLTTALVDRLHRHPKIRVVSPRASCAASAIISLKVEGCAPEEVVQALSKYDIVVSHRRDLVRVSPHLFNTHRDMERLAEALDTIAR
jgi:cysteine desulfurase / selenocysteine lyase